MSEAIDTAVVLLMFVVRIGIPIALTLAFGRWLERKLRPQDEAQEERGDTQAARLSMLRKSNIIRLHCWDIKRCEPSERAHCAACRHPELPCWLALQVEGGKVRPQCFSCSFYKPNVQAA